jgi:hypothetical protein
MPLIQALGTAGPTPAAATLALAPMHTDFASSTGPRCGVRLANRTCIMRDSYWYNPRQITVSLPAGSEDAWPVRKTLGTSLRAARAGAVRAGRVRMPPGAGADRAVPNGRRNLQLFRGCEQFSRLRFCGAASPPTPTCTNGGALSRRPARWHPKTTHTPEKGASSARGLVPSRARAPAGSNRPYGNYAKVIPV